MIAVSVPTIALSSLGFCSLALLCAVQARQPGETLLWLRLAKGKQARQRPYAPGLAELGIDPAAIVLMRLPDLQSLLRAGVDCVRHGGAATAAAFIRR